MKVKIINERDPFLEQKVNEFLSTVDSSKIHGFKCWDDNVMIILDDDYLKEGNWIYIKLILILLR